MRWSANNVAQFCRDVGFYGADLVDAVAIVEVTSGGHDDFHYAGGLNQRVDLRGLFGIDVADRPQLLQFDLFNPSTNCAVAYGMYDNDGGSLRWHPAYGSRAWSNARAAAAVAVHEAYRPDLIPNATGDAAAVGTLAAGRSTLREMGRTLADAGRWLRQRH